MDGLGLGSEAQADACADVVLPARSPAIACLAAVDRFPMGKHNDGLSEGVIQLDFTTPIR